MLIGSVRIPFDPVSGPKLMVLLGYERTHYASTLRDVGDAENGPRLSGHPSYTEWRRGDHYVIERDGFVVDAYVLGDAPL